MADGREAQGHLPVGTVTLLFVDVEGSTQLIRSLGERYAAVRARLRELVREASARWKGYEVDWAGDGAFLAFAGARDAVGAALDLQRAIGTEEWPPDGVLRVRIGLHTGEPELVDEGYVGLDVHVAARVSAAGHGGQVIVSQATRDVAGDEPFPGASFRPLGRHRLKDVPERQPLFQLAAHGLGVDFPPLRTLAGATLPALHHRLVGRATDLALVQSLLTRPDVRLVTITGPGGAGKSRLALEVAGEAAVHRPVHLVGLAPVSNRELVPAAIARAIGIREAPGRTLFESIGEALAETGALILLDNLEHLPGAANDVRELLDAAPDVKLLVTSRVPLRLSAEHVVPLAPLPVPDASELFSELAAARGIVLREDTHGSIEEICRRLDGLPLAIELVAARLVVLPPAQVLEALGQGLALEMEGPVDLPERQRTLRATLEWSYDLLSDSQRELHETLAVFAGGCMLADARKLTGASPSLVGDLEGLVAWSLLRSEVADGDVRLSMLETVRDFAETRLEAEGTLADHRRRHAELFLELAVAAQEELSGPDQRAWLERLEQESDNIRAALDWLISTGRVEDALRMIAALERFWRAHGHVTEARGWLSLALGLAVDVPADVRADALWTAAQQANAQYDWAAAVPLLEEALALYRAEGRGREVVFALSDLGFVSIMRDDLEQAAAYTEEALSVARELDDRRAIAAALINRGEVRSLEGDHERAVADYEEALALRRTLGDLFLVLDASYNLAAALFRAGDLERARSVCEESRERARALGEALHLAAAQFLLAELELQAGDADAAEQSITESLALYTELDNERARSGCLVVLAAVALAQGKPEEAARRLGAATALRGDLPIDSHEQTLLATLEPELEAVLGERYAALLGEGQERGAEVIVPAVVTVDSE